MVRPRHRPEKITRPAWDGDPWLDPLPAPEVKEGGESTWELWHEESRRMDLAFAPTQPSMAAPLTASSRTREAPAPAEVDPRATADALMVVARRNNRVCPQPALWVRLYGILGGPGHADLQPPPVDPWLWNKLSDLQKRLFFREHLEWAERHGKLGIVAAFMQGMTEDDWLHMG